MVIPIAPFPGGDVPSQRKDGRPPCVGVGPYGLGSVVGEEGGGVGGEQVGTGKEIAFKFEGGGAKGGGYVAEVGVGGVGGGGYAAGVYEGGEGGEDGGSMVEVCGGQDGGGGRGGGGGRVFEDDLSHDLTEILSPQQGPLVHEGHDALYQLQQPRALLLGDNLATLPSSSFSTLRHSNVVTTDPLVLAFPLVLTPDGSPSEVEVRNCQVGRTVPSPRRKHSSQIAIWGRSTISERLVAVATALVAATARRRLTRLSRALPRTTRRMHAQEAPATRASPAWGRLQTGCSRAQRPTARPWPRLCRRAAVYPRSRRNTRTLIPVATTLSWSPQSGSG